MKHEPAAGFDFDMNVVATTTINNVFHAISFDAEILLDCSSAGPE